MNGVRPSMAGSFELGGLKGLSKKPTEGADGQRLSIKRESVKYGVNPGGNTDIGELQIENERLQTSCMILSQKLKMKEDDNSEELTKLQSELNQWREKYKNMRGDNEELQDKIDELEKSAKGKGSLSEAEQQKMRSRINELEAERD